jgi:choline dehydrogenase-like flavoprotein
MLRFKQFSQFGVMVSDLSRGRVRERFGRPEVRYDVNDDDVAAFKRGIELLCELYWEAGATTVYPPIDKVGELQQGDTRTVREAQLKAHNLSLMAFHPLGTARADARPAHGVVDGDLKLHDSDGVYVADGSVVPSSLGVNPQITIMALASRLAYRLLDQPAPKDEPHPEAIAHPRIQRAHAITA